ncbi:MAG TPA: ABC transporter permease [Trueperaceae bacterium]|nr:ABC transporter permease [Trueperaceae bacterium]
MLGYLPRRLLQAVPTLIGVLLVVFFFVRALPGDPARLYAGPEANATEIAQVRKDFGLDRPMPTQFVYFLRNLTRGSLGLSFRNNQPATQVIAGHFLPTLWLSVAAIAMASILGIIAGIGAATNRDSPVDLGITVLSILGISTPSFFLGILFIYAFAVRLHLLPISGGPTAAGIVLPALTLAASSLGTIARFSRSSLLEVLGEDYVRTARAKGLHRTRVIGRHALRNALIPVLTITGLQFGFLLSGAVIVETVFNYPGLGWLLIQSIDARDYPVIQGLMLVFALEFLLINLAVDLLYAAIDPRIRYD